MDKNDRESGSHYQNPENEHHAGLRTIELIISMLDPFPAINTTEMTVT
jgi:hypothetical protein